MIIHVHLHLMEFLKDEKLLNYYVNNIVEVHIHGSQPVKHGHLVVVFWTTCVWTKYSLFESGGGELI